MVAFALTAMVACDKEDDGGTSGPSINDNNIIALNDDITSVESTADYYGGEDHYIVSCVSEQAHFLADIDPSLVGTTIDLTTGLNAEGYYGFSYEGILDGGEYYEVRQSGGHGTVYHYDSYSGENIGTSLFSSGTMVTTYDDNGFTLTLNGKLKDGKTLVVKSFVPKENVGSHAEG